MFTNCVAPDVGSTSDLATTLVDDVADDVMGTVATIEENTVADDECAELAK